MKRSHGERPASGGRDLPLSSVRVVDLTQAWAGPFATKQLADMGAEVIKIESATHPDVLRLWAPPADARGPITEINPWFHACNSNKLSVSLKLDTEEGRHLLLELVTISDIVIDNFSARVMKNLGLAYDDLRAVKEDIICLSMPAYGMTGPYSNYVGYGEAVEAIGGLTMMTGYPDQPIRLGVALVDVLASYHAVIALLAALTLRKRTGRGQFIDVSHFEACGRILGEELIATQLTGQQPPRLGNRHVQFAPQGCYPCRGDDAWVVISCETDAQWTALAAVIGNPLLTNDPALGSAPGRQTRHDDLDRAISEWTATRDKFEVMRLCQERGVPAGAVLHAGEVASDPQLAHRRFLEEVEHPVVGRRRVEGVNFRLTKTPARVSTPAPMFGQHTHYVLTQLIGKSEEEFGALRDRGTVGRQPELSYQPE